MPLPQETNGNSETSSKQSNRNRDYKNGWFWLMLVVTFLIGIALIVLFIVFINEEKPDQQRSLIVGFIGVILSYLGIAFAIYQIYQANRQIKKIADVSEATQKAIETTNTEIQNLHSVIDLTINIEDIKTVQDEITSSKYEWAHFRLRELQGRVIEIKEHKYIKESEDLTKLIDEAHDEIRDVIQTLQKQINEPNHQIIDRDRANSSLNITYELLSTLKARHKNNCPWIKNKP